MYTKQDMLNWIAANPDVKAQAVLSYTARCKMLNVNSDIVVNDIQPFNSHVAWVEAMVETPNKGCSVKEIVQQLVVAQCVMLRLMATKDVSYAVRYVNEWIEHKKIKDSFDLALSAYRGYLRFKNVRITLG